MRYRGEFICGNGLVIPNNITIFGRQTILELAFLNTSEDLWVGLCAATYTDTLTQDDIDEPAFANGYARQQISRDITGWPGSGLVNNEAYIESDWLIWTATGDGFDIEIERMWIGLTEDDVGENVFALSATLPAPILIGAATAEADRKFKYRIYAR